METKLTQPETAVHQQLIFSNHCAGVAWMVFISHVRFLNDAPSLVKANKTDRTEKALAAMTRRKLSLRLPPQVRKNLRRYELRGPARSYCAREEWGWRTGHILQEARERLIVLREESVKKARRVNDLLIGSLLHFLALCVIQTLLYFVVSRWCVDILITAENPVSGHCSVCRRSPSRSAVPFPLKSFNYFFCILAALSVERYIPLLE